MLRARRPADRRRDPVRPRAAPGARSPATTRTSCRTSTCSARRSAAGSSRCRRSSPTTRSSASSARARTARRSAATRSRAPSGARCSSCSRPASRRPTRRASARGCATRSTRRRPRRCDEIRSRGLWFGLDLEPDGPPAREACERLLEQGVLAKDTHERTIRLAPPLTITDAEADWLIERLLDVLGAAPSLRLAAAAPPPSPASFAAWTRSTASIVAQLLDDGRLSLAELGERVSLSSPAVKRRVDRLRGTRRHHGLHRARRSRRAGSGHGGVRRGALRGEHEPERAARGARRRARGDRRLHRQRRCRRVRARARDRRRGPRGDRRADPREPRDRAHEDRDRAEPADRPRAVSRRAERGPRTRWHAAWRPASLAVAMHPRRALPYAVVLAGAIALLAVATSLGHPGHAGAQGVEREGPVRDARLRPAGRQRRRR